eukprot:TRINITY_DN6801_c1_g1_i2.p1 TRINITY_DN6801_c1_g1~~TRINITY_DN6801_c1_g1_i2.p1  ORF type:complete len:465 (+),score=214.90 TRINITY_DN6801_c1_g1_i2:31-1395(+)
MGNFDVEDDVDDGYSPASTSHIPSGGIYRRHAIICLLVCAFGGLLFGYNTAVIAGALPLLIEDFYGKLTPAKQGVLTCSILLGATIGSTFGSIIASTIGKPKTILIIGLATLIGAVGLAATPYLWVMVLFRELLGLGVGIASVICGTFAADYSPPKLRGLITASFQVSITLGILISYIIGIIFQDVSGGYHYMFGLGALPGIGLICVVPFCNLQPLEDSPINVGMNNTKTDEETEEDYNQRNSGLTVYVQMFRRAQKGVFLGVVLSTALQFTGINAIMYYGPSVFAAAGLSTGALTATTIIGFWNFLSTFPALILVVRVSRRVLLLSTLLVMAVTCFLLGLDYLFFADTSFGGIFSIILLLFYISAFEAGIGSLFWVVMTEFFPSEYKDSGASLMNIIQWTLNIVLSASFPSLVSLFGTGPLFIFFSLVGFVAIGIFFFYLPRPAEVEIDRYEA